MQRWAASFALGRIGEVPYTWLMMREFSLLQHIFRSVDHATSWHHVLIGPGDDMALIRLGSRALLVAVDQVVDGRHVRLATTPIELVARKAITRSMSDIAAMAGTPVATLAAVVLPVNFSEQRASELFDAMRATADELGAPLIGGDIAMHDDANAPFVCSVTVLAEPATKRGAVTRAGALPGDTLYVTGELGGSLDANGLGHHLTFTPRINEAIALAEALGDRLHAMIDISDGLGRDASHIAERSNVRIEIDGARLPCRDGVDWRHAMSDGEDYELCFAAMGEVPPTIAGAKVSAVGRIVPAESEKGSGGGGYVTVFANGMRFDADQMGWEHAGS
jgi:thiamine-monophosphate kinase